MSGSSETGVTQEILDPLPDTSRLEGIGAQPAEPAASAQLDGDNGEGTRTEVDGLQLVVGVERR